jgi:hypothetical protein
MGFIQKLATKSDRVKVKNTKDCDCSQYYKIVTPKLTWKYVLNLKNWK